MRRTPALIVGGGPAGAAAAIRLAEARLPHLLVERSRETGDALCGGFLSWRTLDTLAALGIAADMLNRDRITHVRLFAGHRAMESPLPHPALCVSRHRLDTVMLDAAIARGAAVERGVAAKEIANGIVRTGDGADIMAEALFLASGKHDVRGLARPAGARGDDPTLGLRVRLPPAPALTAMLAGSIELHAFDRGYVGLALQEDGSANLCLAVHRSRMAEAGSPAALLAALGAAMPVLGERMAWMTDAPIDAIANVPYGWRQRTGREGVFRLGDQAGVIPSLAGEGMGIAIASGAAAADAYARGGAGASTAWQAGFARSLARPIGIAGLVRMLAESRMAPALLPIARPGLIRFIANATRVGRRAS